MSRVILVGVSLLAGGVLTSFAEYHFKYNLFDYIVAGLKRVKGWFSKTKAVVEADVTVVKKQL
jgi:hypothetical protein